MLTISANTWKTPLAQGDDSVLTVFHRVANLRISNPEVRYWVRDEYGYILLDTARDDWRQYL